MAQYFLLCLVLLNAFMAVASENAETKVGSGLDPPASAPLNNEKPYKAEAPTTRRLGKHQPEVLKAFGSAPVCSPSQGPSHTTASTNTEPNNRENVSVEGQAIHLQKHHHSIDKSVAGGGVILGGLATTFLVAVFCYIRATGRHKSETQTHQSNTEIAN